MIDLLKVSQYAILLGLSISASSVVIPTPSSQESGAPISSGVEEGSATSASAQASSPVFLQAIAPSCASPNASTLNDDTISNSLAPNPFIQRIPESATSVIFSYYKQPIPWRDAIQCLSIAESVAETYPYGTLIRERQLEYTHGSVKLKLFPTAQMTWTTWTIAIWGMRTFSVNYQTMESAFEVQNSGSETGKGIFELVSTSQHDDQMPPLVARRSQLSTNLPSVSPSTDKSNFVSASAVQDNLVSVNGSSPISPDALPSSPFTIVIPGTEVSVVFTNYGRTIPISDARECILQAINQATRQIRAGHRDDLVDDVLRYRSGVSSLVLYPTAQLRWEGWSKTIYAISAFVEVWEAAEFIFNVNYSTTEPWGTGYLGLTSQAQASNNMPIAASSTLTSRTLENNSTSMTSLMPSLSSNALPPGPSFNFNVPGTHVSLDFSNYGPRLPITNIYESITIAMYEVFQQVRDGHRDDAVGRFLEYSSGSAMIRLHPVSMTWALWATVLEGMKLFVFNYEPVSLNFGVTYRGYGIGFGLISRSQLVEPLPAGAGPSLTSRTIDDGMPTSNSTDSSSLNTLPPAPFALPTGIQDIYVIVTNYGKPFSNHSALVCLTLASSEADFQTEHGSAHMSIGRHIKGYKDANVRLSLSPETEMTWQMWERGVEGLFMFYHDYDPVELSFAIFHKGTQVGSGNFSVCCSLSRPTIQSPALKSRTFS